MKLNKFHFSKILYLLIFSLINFHGIPRDTEICLETFVGKASFYASKFNGRRTASGEIYSGKQYTCAHKTLPFGTFIRVTHEGNCKSVIVKVNDRGPFVKGRIVDLSYVAAKKIDLIQKGTAKVNIEILGTTISDNDENHIDSISPLDKYSFKD